MEKPKKPPRKYSTRLALGLVAWKPFVPQIGYESPIKMEGIPHYLAVAVDAKIEKIMKRNKGW